VEETNRGMSHAINRGFEMCEGEIITWISSDDVYLPGAFQEVARRWSETRHAGAIVGSFQFMNAKSEMDPVKYCPMLPCCGPVDLSLADPKKWRLHQVSTFYGRSALDSVGRWVRQDLRHNMDRELIYRIAHRYEVVLVDKPLAAFRIHPRSKSWSITNILTMAREYASIQHMFLTEDLRDNQRRKMIARYRIAKGYIKYAKHNPHLFKAVVALFIALAYGPGLLFERGYIVAWFSALRIVGLLRKLKHLVRPSPPCGYV
jgi:glycosyltransferase involved in cell wall biosynthesis